MIFHTQSLDSFKSHSIRLIGRFKLTHHHPPLSLTNLIQLYFMVTVRVDFEVSFQPASHNTIIAPIALLSQKA